MDWIITIKEEYIYKILNGIKKYEVRTRIPKELEVGDRIFVCKPKMSGKIVARFDVSGVYKYGKFGAWELKSWYLGIKKEEYFKYVHDKSVVYLIGIENARSIEKPLFVKDFGMEKAPQWFAKCK